MKKITMLLMFFTAGLFISCEESDSPTVVPHVSFENDRIFGLSPGAANDTQDIKVYATMSSGSDRVYSLQVDETSTLAAGQYTVPATVTIPANTKMGTFPVTISSTTLDSEKTLIIKMVDITDGTFTGAAGLTLTAKVVCEQNEVAFELILDAYGSESVWELYSGEEVIATGGPYTDLTAAGVQPAKNFSFCLPAGSYTFIMYDLYGDGMCCTVGNGSYKLTNVKTGTVLATGGTFTDSSIHEFTLE